MFWNTLRSSLLIALGALGALGIQHFSEGDALDRYAARLARQGQPEKAIFLQDMRGILGKPAAIAMAGALEADFGAIRDQAVSLSRRVVEGQMKAEEAEKIIVELAAASCLKSQHEVAHVAKLISPKLVRFSATALLKVPDLRVSLSAATALAVAQSPGKPDMRWALKVAAEQAM